MISLSSVYFLYVVAAYCIGSIPTGYIIARFVSGNDIRRFGSGNIGATNVARLLGLKYFFLVFFLDACKAYAYLVMCASMAVPQPVIFMAAIALLIGNSCSLFLQGTGGKGVATIVGIMFAIHPMLLVNMVITWLVVLAYTKTVGIASAVTMVLLPCYALFVTDFYGVLLVLFLASWIVWRHRSNIRLYYMVR